jgi:hypothetical protein
VAAGPLAFSDSSLPKALAGAIFFPKVPRVTPDEVAGFPNVDCRGTGSGRFGLRVKRVGESILPDLRVGDSTPKPGVGDMTLGELSVENVMDELNDWSTSSGRAVSVMVGEGGGEPNLDGKDSMRGEEEKASMLG